jgi:hypothetical protein
VVPADIAFADRCTRIVLEEVRTGPVAVRKGQAGLVGRGWGCRRSSRVGRRLGYSRRVACRQGLGRHLGGLVVGMRAVRLGPEVLLVRCCDCDWKGDGMTARIATGDANGYEGDVHMV